MTPERPIAELLGSALSAAALIAVVMAVAQKLGRREAGSAAGLPAQNLAAVTKGQQPAFKHLQARKCLKRSRQILASEIAALFLHLPAHVMPQRKYIGKYLTSVV
jgi:hypothetical protein